MRTLGTSLQRIFTQVVVVFNFGTKAKTKAPHIVCGGTQIKIRF